MLLICQKKIAKRIIKTAKEITKIIKTETTIMKITTAIVDNFLKLLGKMPKSFLCKLSFFIEFSHF